MAIALYLFGMGLINPLGTAIALHPFGQQAGLASALLGFLQMGCAAIGASLASVLPFPPSVSLAVILTTGSALALLVFLPVALRQPQRGAGLAAQRNRQEDRCDGLLSLVSGPSRRSPQVSKHPGRVCWPVARASAGFRTTWWGICRRR